MATNLKDLVAQLQQQHAAVGRARTALYENSSRARAAFNDTDERHALCIRWLVSAPREIEEEQALVAELEERRAIVLNKQASLEGEIAAAQDWRTVADSRARDREFDRQKTLRTQLQMLHEGRLLFAPNQVYARVEDLDARLKKANARIEGLRAQFEAQLQQAEALLAEPVAG